MLDFIKNILNFNKMFSKNTSVYSKHKKKIKCFGKPITSNIVSVNEFVYIAIGSLISR